MERTVVVVVGNPLNYARLARRSEGLKWSPSAEDQDTVCVSCRNNNNNVPLLIHVKLL